MKLYNLKTKELNDERILSQLRKLPQMYENGEISEVKDSVKDILDALTAFERDYPETM